MEKGRGCHWCICMIVKYLNIKNHSPFLLKANYLKLFSYPELRFLSICMLITPPLFFFLRMNTI
jgi:hypothetical protein